MGNSLDSLNADAGVLFTTVVLIEGYQHALTDGSPTAVATALAASSHPFDSYESVIGGLSPKWDLNQRNHPWRALDDEPASFGFTVAMGPNITGEIVDTFGEDVFKRTAAAETSLIDGGSLTPASTAVIVRSAAAFPASNSTIYIGPEAIGYEDNESPASEEFLVLTRAKWTPLETSVGDPFARAHTAFDIGDHTGDPIGVMASPLVTDSPTKWIGRWVAVYLLVDRGGVLDTIDEGYRAFVGTIADVGQDGAGQTVIECSDVRRRIYETQILRNQYRATLQEGVPLTTGQEFNASNLRTSTLADANPLIVVASGASGPNQINAGVYSAQDLGEAITAWMQAEKAAARLLFHCAYDGAYQRPDGVHGNLSYQDPTSGGATRICVLLLPDEHIAEFLGWNGQPRIQITSFDRDGFINSPSPPLKITLWRNGATFTKTMTNPSGTWVDQSDFLPPALRDAAGLVQGVLKIGDMGYVLATRNSDTSFDLNFADVSDFFPSDLRPITVEDDATLDVTQVIVAEATLRTLVLSVLLSTGTTSYNDPSFDVLPESMGCAIPHSILTDDFATDLANIPDADRTLCMIIDKPTRFVDRFNADFLARWSFFVWREGRLSVRTWSTPTTGALGAVAFGHDDAASVNGSDLRATARESFDSMQNIVKIEFERGIDGDLLSSLTVEDKDSIGAHGPRGFKIELRNTAGRTAVGDVLGLLASFSSALPHFSKPSIVVERAMDRRMFAQLPPGQPVLLTAREIRNPETGRRYSHVTQSGGLAGWPGVVVSNRHNWGSSVPGVNGSPTRADTGGEVEIMIFDRVTSAPYSPCAELDDTADAGGFTSGYNSGTNTVRCYANRHSTTGQDAANFVAGDEIEIIEIDPPDAASPLTWTVSVVSQSTTDIVIEATLTAFDAAKFYRVRSAGYAAAVATQRTDAYQADSVDGLVADARQPYGLVYTGAGQAAVFTASASTEIPARYAAAAYGDGVPLDVGYERDIARLANNLVDYKTAVQAPMVTSEEWTYAGSGTWELVACIPIYIAPGLLVGGQTILLEVAPEYASTDGGSASVRYRLGKIWATGDTRDDPTFADPYVETTFTKTSTAYAVATAVGLDTRHIIRAPGALGGLAWLSVEITAKVKMRGPVAHLRVAPRSAP